MRDDAAPGPLTHASVFGARESQRPSRPGLLTSPELTMLARLDLAQRRLVPGLNAGERRSPRTARSAEFADFRPYSVGDDFRQIDWRAYARLERLMLRLYVAEDETALNVVVDTSASMGLGKMDAARRLAAAVAFLGLGAMDRVGLGTLAGAVLPHVRGAAATGRVESFLERLEHGGASSPSDALRLRWTRPGVTVVISDFLVEGDWSEACAAMRRHREQPVLWQVLAPEEENPGLRGDYRLVDIESAGSHEITITPALVLDYLVALDTLRERLSRAASGARGRFVHSRASDTLEEAMLAGMRAGAIVRA